MLQVMLLIIKSYRRYREGRYLINSQPIRLRFFLVVFWRYMIKMSNYMIRGLCGIES